MAKFWVTVRLATGSDIVVKGREAETIIALVEAGSRGITSLDASRAGWAYRLAAYIHRLKTDYGISIETRRESHDGGSHGRYFLRTAVEILSRSDEPTREAA